VFNSAHTVALTLSIDQEYSPLYNVIFTSLLAGRHGNTAFSFTMATILVSLGERIRSLSVKKERERELYKHHSSHGNNAFSFSEATILVSLGDGIISLCVKNKWWGALRNVFY
jgi:hypothetical protein